jgi:hypothetical protein
LRAGEGQDIEEVEEKGRELERRIRLGRDIEIQDRKRRLGLVLQIDHPGIRCSKLSKDDDRSV